MRKKAAPEKLRDFTGIKYRVVGMQLRFSKPEGINFCRNEMGKCKFANKAIVKVYVVVRELRLVGILVRAVLLRELLRQMLVGMEGLRQHCEQYGQHQHGINGN